MFKSDIWNKVADPRQYELLEWAVTIIHPHTIIIISSFFLF
jgi:hypothetical protein